MKKNILFGFVFMFIVNMATAQAKKTAGPLDKKTYACEITDESKKKPAPVKDDLKFAAGKFNCKTLAEEGYKTCTYEANVDSTETPIVITFTAKAAGEKGETFEWEGTITGDEITGTAIIYKKEKEKKSYSFTGTIKGKKPAK